MAKELKDLTKSDENYSQWYNDLVVKAGLAENSAVRGCMVIKPYGYAIWVSPSSVLLLASSVTTSAALSSRPGVFRLNMRITALNSRK